MVVAACIPEDDSLLGFATATATAQEQITPESPEPTFTPTPPPTQTPTWIPTPTPVPTPTEAPTPPSPLPIPVPSPTPLITPTADPALSELDVVSAAMATLMADNGLTFIPNPVTANEPPCTTGTQAMTRFPDTASIVGTSDKLNDPSGASYTSGAGTRGDKDGYLLFGHDIKADSQQSTIVSYVRSVRSTWCYTAESDGYVRQYDEAGNETPRPPRPTPTPTPIPTPTPTLTSEEAAAEDLQRFLETRVGELAEIADAVGVLMRHANLISIPNPVAANTTPCTRGTQDMSAFPDTASRVGTADKMVDPFGQPYVPGDKDGYLLVDHDIVANDEPDSDRSFLGFRETTWCYTIDPDGWVHQYDEAGALLGGRYPPER